MGPEQLWLWRRRAGGSDGGRLHQWSCPGHKLQLYWFPSLTLASNTVGTTYYGNYTDTNGPPLGRQRSVGNSRR